jgi:hypothetical protein
MFFNNNNCPPFNNWAYNPQYINQQAFLENQAQIQAYEQQQDSTVAEAATKLREFLNAASQVDNKHQQELLLACLAVVAEQMNWHI